MFGASSGSAFPATKPASFSFGSSNNNASNSSTNPGASGGSGFSLGGSNANTSGGFGAKPATTGFGATTNNANNTSNASNTGGLFGGTNTAAAPSTGGLFGNNNNNSNNSNPPGGLFGGSNTNTAGSTGTSLFGNNTSNNNTTAFGKPANALGNSFGASGANSAPQNTTGGGIFGASSASQPSQSTTGGLFGKPAANPAGGLFGGSNTQTQQPAATSGGLFGNNSNSGGLFGQQASTSNGTNAGNTFSANNSQPSFSWSNQQQNAGPSGTLSNLEIKLPTTSKTQQNDSNYTPAVNDQLTKLKEQWDPNSAKCALKTHLYNKFSEQEISILLQQPRPADESPEDWEKAMANRPSPLHYPVKVTSFTEIAQRVEVQLDHVAKSRVFLNNVYEKSAQLSSQRDLDTTTRIMKAKVRHTKLSRRLLKLATLLAVLKLKGYPLLPEEEEISKEFQVLNAKLSDPNGAVGKLSDLYARLAILKGRSEDLSSQLESSINTMNGGLNNLSNTKSDASGEGSTQTEQVVQSLTKLLYKQQIGLGYLNDVVQQDLAAVEKQAAKKQ